MLKMNLCWRSHFFFFFTFSLFNDHLMMDDLLILVIMDNKHYFRLYLIRIKHDLLLFALLLTAIQSLIYLILAFVSEKVKHWSRSFFVDWGKKTSIFFISVRSFTIYFGNSSFYYNNGSFSTFYRCTSTRKILSQTSSSFVFCCLVSSHILQYDSNISSKISIFTKVYRYDYIHSNYNSYDITNRTFLDRIHGFNHVDYSLFFRTFLTWSSWWNKQSSSNGIQTWGTVIVKNNWSSLSTRTEGLLC